MDKSGGPLIPGTWVEADDLPWVSTAQEQLLPGETEVATPQVEEARPLPYHTNLLSADSRQLASSEMVKNSETTV
jgi:hypothetical protein